MPESVLSAHVSLGSEEAEALVLQWFDAVGLSLGHAERDRLFAWFDDDLPPLPGLAEFAVEVQVYRLEQGWSQLRWRFHHGSSDPAHALSSSLLARLRHHLQEDGRWSIDLCQEQPGPAA